MKHKALRRLIVLASGWIIAGAAAAPAQVLNHHRLFLGTGEYDPAAVWDSVMVWDRADLLNGDYSPDRLVPMDPSGVNFGHMIYYRKATDELYVTSLFGNAIVVYANASTMTGATVPTRVINGVLTQLSEPHGLWIDETRDMLYVGSRLTAGSPPGRILIWHNASTVTGNIAPDRYIAGGLTRIDEPFNTFIDPVRDYLYVANANGASSNRGVVIYHNASLISGNVAPSRQIAGNLTPFYSTHPSVHNVILDLTRDHMYVVNHASSVYVFHNASVATGNIPADRTLSGFTNALGLFMLPDEDTLYVSDGPGPVACSLGQQVKIFNNASTLTGAVGGTPDRAITWSAYNCTYYPPQPIAIDVTCRGGTGGRARIAFGPGANDDTLRVKATVLTSGAPDPITDGVVVRVRYDTGTQTFTLPGGGDARWTMPGVGRWKWTDAAGLADGVTSYKLRASGAGRYRLQMNAINREMTALAGASNADVEFDHGGTAECSASAAMSRCRTTATAMSCRP